MVRFDNLFGDGANQIPYGSLITSATLTVSGRGDGSSSATAGLYRMLVDWSATRAGRRCDVRPAPCISTTAW